MKENLKKMRFLANLTQQEAAKKIGVSPSTIGMWEIGRSTPRFSLLPVIAAAYRCKISDILGDNQQDGA